MCVFAGGVPKMIKKAPFYGHFYAPGNCSTGRVKLKTKNGSHPVRGVVRLSPADRSTVGFVRKGDTSHADRDSLQGR
jgi:hypothetical protein